MSTAHIHIHKNIYAKTFDLAELNSQIYLFFSGDLNSQFLPKALHCAEVVVLTQVLMTDGISASLPSV